ncbi:class I SAM-dependent methyltransferase [Amycolatopsis anabasis]|uniref:class I SAM-dependent methyltransferase n=1 Tax=Amycolatopsis anabasis TaxID=1840409 RepID=UPI00131A853A|nr:class I SAM-dependent methyltransferase [Amycolatopsis anabasis]
MIDQQNARECADLTADEVVRLYYKYRDSLRVVRDEQRGLHERGMRAQIDDIEAELTYLLIRERRPVTVAEIGALHGWSTTWILRALRDNEYGRLITVDLTDAADYLVPRSLAFGRWTFCQGDVRTLTKNWLHGVDYLFLDAEHSARFARWYLAEMLPVLAPETSVSVHDVFRRRQPCPFREGAEVLDWLAHRNLGYFTASRAAAREVYERIVQFKRKAGLAEPIHRGERNPMIFFRTPASRG